MPKPVHSRSTMIRAFGLLLAVVGLVGQLSFGRVAQRADAAAAVITALASATIDCHPAPPAPGDRAPHGRHGAEPPLCPTQLTLEQPSFTIVRPMDPPETTISVVLRGGLRPPSRGPPSPTARVGKPRAPPVQT